MRHLVAILAVSAALVGTGVSDRLLHNPRQLTAAALERWSRAPAEAAPLLERARALDPGSPRTLYNAGTAGLAIGEPDSATVNLERAATTAVEEGDVGDGFAADIFYNLGNAALSAGEPEAAAAAYRDCLRLEPAHRDAKHNLEIALRRQRSTETELPSGATGAPRSDAAEASARAGRTTPSAAGAGHRDSGTEGSAASDAVPRFTPQPDLSREQAAALLEAAEAVERQQRRRLARQPSPPSTLDHPDW